MEIEVIPVLTDNYAFLLLDQRAGAVGVVDPGEPDPIVQLLDDRGLGLTHIFNTHHHGDHIGGNARLKEKFGACLIGPRSEARRIAGIDLAVGEGDRVPFGATAAAVLETPGHTRGHVAYWFADDAALFSGDALFSLGCGRLFEGSAAEMWASLARLRDLPAATRLYPGHEYTRANGRFAAGLDPTNQDLAGRLMEVERLREAGRPTIPVELGVERRTNPFLRADDPAFQRVFGMAGADPVRVFQELRSLKDRA